MAPGAGGTKGPLALHLLTGNALAAAAAHPPADQPPRPPVPATFIVRTMKTRVFRGTSGVEAPGLRGCESTHVPARANTIKIIP